MERILEPKVQVIVALGAATAAKCKECFTKLYGTAKELDVSDAELRAAVDIGERVGGKSQEFMRAFIEEATHGAVKAHAASGSDTGGCGCA
jgi:alkylhydroperoxidase/carboxymuconolactone decarboxylase family protein YurZ